jgi:hypothetical protein
MNKNKRVPNLTATELMNRLSHDAEFMCKREESDPAPKNWTTWNVSSPEPELSPKLDLLG